EVLDQILANPKADSYALTFSANLFAQLGQIAKVEQALVTLVKLTPENPEGRYDLAAIQAMQGKNAEAMETLRTSLTQSSQRLERDPKANNLYSNALGDTRFASLRAMPEFVKLIENAKPK